MNVWLQHVSCSRANRPRHSPPGHWSLAVHSSPPLAPPLHALSVSVGSFRMQSIEFDGSTVSSTLGAHEANPAVHGSRTTVPHDGPCQSQAYNHIKPNGQLTRAPVRLGPGRSVYF